MIREDCFAFRSIPAANGKGYRVRNCDCLTELKCDKGNCPFFKDKNSVKQYQFRSGSNYNKFAIGYVDL